MPVATTKERLQSVRALVERGLCRADIAKTLKMGETLVGRLCSRIGVRPKDGRSKRSAAPRFVGELTSNVVRDAFIYRDGQVLRVRSAGAHKPMTIVGGRSAAGYLHTTFRGRTVFVHRLVWLLHHDNLPKMLDHINGDRLDNRIENLRPASPQQNSANMSGVFGAVPFKGVTFHKQVGKFQASITCNGRCTYLGLFDSAIAAAQAYDAAAMRLFGAYAKTNRDLGIIHG